MVNRRWPVLVLLVALPACAALIDIKDLTPAGDDATDAAGDADASALGDAIVSDAPAEGSAMDGGCGDTTSSKDNCGRCNHSCLGGECKDSKCQPVTLASNRGVVSGIAIDASYVYFTSISLNTIARVPKAGGNVDPIASAPAVHVPKRIAVNTTHVFWSNSEPGSGAIMRCPKLGCPINPPDTLSTPSEPIGIALDGDFIYWADRNNKHIGRTLFDGGAFQQYPILDDLPVAVAVSGSKVFAIEDFSGQVEVNDSADGGANVLFGVNGTDGRDIAVDPLYVYWAAGVDFGFDGRLTRASKNGGTQQPLGSANGDPMAIALDGQRIYWTAWQRLSDGGVTSATVQACDRSGCGVEALTLAEGQDLPRGIAVDDDAVYWGGNGVVMKVAKP